MPTHTTPAELPETVETLLDWKLGNSDEKFNDKQFLKGFKKHAKEANDLFDAAFSKGL